MPKVVDHGAYRRELLGQCLKLFAAKGYGSLTMRQIAEHLGISTGTLYHYFPSKEALFEQLLDHVSGEHIEKAMPEILATADVRTRIVRLFHHITCHEEECQQEALIFLNHLFSSNREEVRKVYAKVNERYRQAAKAIVQLEDEDLANLLSCLIDGLVINRIYDNTIDYQRIGAILGEMLAVYLQHRREREERQQCTNYG
ncbi:MAG: TetR/AcrR family transcriptional regulator [Pseudanabaenaceae cyanobacterium SKYGB_i_bin29]|nr:TetR/AcrR family transcriptional regulator [Pseudanabaenaceae cyanobacterium SKYG29]MDW8422166.1 TetR/AcrR family transcriptional regulator [Pseudanabaenaceae cyanobacterium SKYGB_i_bin29]